MDDEDEIRNIMRTALDKLKDDTLADMSAKDQRLVSIAQRPSAEQVRERLTASRRAAMNWPFAQATFACGVLFVIFMIGLAFSMSGQRINTGLGISAILAAFLVFPSVLQMRFYARYL